MGPKVFNHMTFTSSTTSAFRSISVSRPGQASFPSVARGNVAQDGRPLVAIGRTARDLGARLSPGPCRARPPCAEYFRPSPRRILTRIRARRRFRSTRRFSCGTGSHSSSGCTRGRCGALPCPNTRCGVAGATAASSATRLTAAPRPSPRRSRCGTRTGASASGRRGRRAPPRCWCAAPTTASQFERPPRDGVPIERRAPSRPR